jgi:hypothetical protein
MHSVSKGIRWFKSRNNDRQVPQVQKGTLKICEGKGIGNLENEMPGLQDEVAGMAYSALQDMRYRLSGLSNL